MVSSINNIFEIPRVIINLADSKLHVPLMLLTAKVMEKIHNDPSCIIMKKGLVTDNPKKSVMDTSGFPPESSPSPIQFYEAYENFMELLNRIAGGAIQEKFRKHRLFCLSRKHFEENFSAVLAFNIETRRIFFNTKSLLTDAAYECCWNETLTKISRDKSDEAAANANRELQRLMALMSHFEGSNSNNRYHPYQNSAKLKADATAQLNTDGKSFRKGKEILSNGPLYLLCGRNGHKASNCTFTHTIKNSPLVCVWQGKIMLKSSSVIVCISHNIGRCTPGKHGMDIIHVCSICGSKSHAASAKSC
ncbi:uncharacterized protein EDB91DRAFT_1090456 [Suillus paluster]|nr:uncharacterized protein EDB91DRAFT_1090456 [Suillus paluster]KAG1717926.1 hypothetical protein EDB91DRAFT_1090456 [Suillus paluster]